MAREVLDRYHDLDEAGRLAFFEALAREFGPDREKLAKAIEAGARSRTTPTPATCILPPSRGGRN